MRSLGVFLDVCLSLVAQVTVTARTAFYHLRLVRQLTPVTEIQ